MKTTARLTFEKIRFDEPKDLHLLIDLQAPAVDWQSRRPPVCVLPVIDVSGSMGGAKLHYAKESAMKLVDHLAPGDFCGLVTFTTDVRVIAPPSEMTVARKAELKAKIGDLMATASTNLAGGMLQGLGLANGGRIPEGIPRRVILFTDGRANAGPATAHADILRLLDANLGRATLSAFGYGTDADQELLRDLSTNGKGNYAFVRDPEDALSAFARERGGLLSTYARDIDVVVKPAASVTLTDVVSDVDSEPLAGGAGRIRVPDLRGEEVRQLVVALRVDATDAPRGVRVADVSGTYHVVAGDRPRSREEHFDLSVDVQRVRPGEEQTTPTRVVDEAVAMAQLVRAQIDAEERARRGDYAGAHDVMTRLYQAARVRGHDVVMDACDQVAASVASAHAYGHSGAMRSSMRKGFSRPVSGMKDAGVEELLERSGRRVKTRAQQAAEDSFAEKGRGDGSDGSSTPRPPRGGSSLQRNRSKRW